MDASDQRVINSEFKNMLNNISKALLTQFEPLKTQIISEIKSKLEKLKVDQAHIQKSLNSIDSQNFMKNFLEDF